MRASAAFQITIVRYGVWRAAVSALIVSAAAALAAWLLIADDTVPAIARGLAGLAGVIVLVPAASLLRCPPMSLRWDTQRWHLGPVSTVGEEPWQGRLAVALDMGAWLLLRFERDTANMRQRNTWLPVQLRGLESRWHALRCAVYSARPEQGRDSGSRTAISPESQE
jgi:hypothetical protein